MPLFETLKVFHDRAPRGGADQMAVDEWLLRSGQISGPLLRIYGWREPTVTMGYFEPASPVTTSFPATPLVRRWTGGGVVLHGRDDELTYSLVVPREHPFFKVKPAESYRQIHGELSAALHECGIPSVLHQEHPALAGGLCFQNAAYGDLLNSSGNKLGGAGQRRTREGLLHQGTLQLGRTVPLNLRKAMPAVLGYHIADARIEIPDAALLALVEDRYGHPEWLHRR